MPASRNAGFGMPSLARAQKMLVLIGLEQENSRTFQISIVYHRGKNLFFHANVIKLRSGGNYDFQFHG